MSARRAPLGWLVVAAVFAVGTVPLHDNSLLTHLATGRLIWGGDIPHSDPYSFTAAGEPWVVQSWFVSLVIGGLEDLVSLAAVRVFFGLVSAVAMALCWRLTAAAGPPLVRLAVVVPVVVMALSGWTHRPYLVAFACLAALLLALDGRLRPELLVPITWLWVNSHGSWPLGIAAIAAYWLGARLDRADTARERTAARWFGIGLAVGVLNPYGPKIFTVPLEAIGKRDVFAAIVEWQAPNFTTVEQLAFLLVIAGTVLTFARCGATWRTALPVVGFVLAGLYSARNVSPAAIVALPAVSAALATRPLRSTLRIPPVPITGLAAVLAAVGLVQVATTDDAELGAYPVDALAFLDEQGLEPTEARVVARDYVGNYFEAVYGTDARVFVDDRFELFPEQVAEDHLELLQAGPDWAEALARYDPDAVLWEADAALTQVLEASEDWEIAYRDDDFVVALPA